MLELERESILLVILEGNCMKEKVEAALALIRPQLQADGGNIELVDVSDGTVKVRLTGACSGCPMAAMTLKEGVERVIKEQVPEVVEVVAL
jgi:Fe-S cluster biogenesis protein NfuA